MDYINDERLRRRVQDLCATYLSQKPGTTAYDPNRDDLFHTEHTLTPLLPLAQKARRLKAAWPQASRLSQSKLADHS
jgi:hypothetical protein